MANLAIKGHATRGKEVIEILEMLGGINKTGHCGNNPNVAYYISHNNNTILCDCVPNIYICVDYTLEEFLEKFPYKVGDKVQHKGATSCGSIFEVEKMRWEENTVKYTFRLFGCNYKTSTLPAEYLQPYKEETMEDKPNLLQQLKDYFDNTPREVVEKEWHEYDKYNEIGPTVDEYLEYVNKIRQPKYPKTYEECCKVLGKTNSFCFEGISLDEIERVRPFIKLLRCRNAYWKIAGEQMGLGKPWEPDWTNPSEIKYCITNTEGHIAAKWAQTITNKILAFPTAEIRDAFYENFKELINECKEFL
jgi:hypothetical protein